MLPWILDTTLRDGEQTPGLWWTREDKLALASALDRLQVPLIEVGIPAMGRAEVETIDRLHDLGLAARLVVWNRLDPRDLEVCLAHSWPDLHVSAPVSAVGLEARLGWSWGGLLDRVRRVVSDAVDAGRRVSFGAEDASRTDDNAVAEVFAVAAEAGACRVRWADTLGLMTPATTLARLTPLCRDLALGVDFHGHNDFGLATANALAARAAGAAWVSTSLLGLGERAGNASLEEVWAAEAFLGSCPEARPAFPEVVALARDAARRAGLHLPDAKPLVGRRVFHHESGIHVDGLLKEAATYEAWAPGDLGGERRFVFGKHSGSTAVAHLARAQGVEVPREAVAPFLESLRHQMAEGRGVDPGAELAAFVAQWEVPR